jgi:hypothetical protein
VPAQQQRQQTQPGTTRESGTAHASRAQQTTAGATGTASQTPRHPDIHTNHALRSAARTQCVDGVEQDKRPARGGNVITSPVIMTFPAANQRKPQPSMVYVTITILHRGALFAACTGCIPAGLTGTAVFIVLMVAARCYGQCTCGNTDAVPTVERTVRNTTWSVLIASPLARLRLCP